MDGEPEQFYSATNVHLKSGTANHLPGNYAIPSVNLAFLRTTLSFFLFVSVKQSFLRTKSSFPPSPVRKTASFTDGRCVRVVVEGLWPMFVRVYCHPGAQKCCISPKIAKFARI